MYGQYDNSAGAKCMMVALHALAVAIAAGLLFGGVAGMDAGLGRRVVLIVLSGVYFVRLLGTLFVMQKRRVTFGEAAIVGGWLIVIHTTMAFFGGRQAGGMEWIGWAGVGLYIIGSYLNTVSEYQRLRWKRRPENKGHLYTGGLFRYAMHINYFGDVVLFCGFAIVAGCGWAWVIPAIMAGGFVFANIPALDRYLAGRYGEEFTEYARRAARFVPWVY